MIQEKKVAFQIKGIRDGLLITLGDGEWPALQEQLLTHIRDRASFFMGARVALDVGNQILHAADLGGLRDKLADFRITLWAVLGNSPLTEQTARVLGMATRIFTPRPEHSNKAAAAPTEGENAIFIRRTLRSGTRVAAQGNVVVVGDVNPGAEIIATGSVVVWGKLRGVVHAGADGDEQAGVYALELNPTQLRIASYIAVQPQRKGKPAPEVAHISNGQVVALHWETR